MRRMDQEAESEEVKRLQAQADQLLRRLQGGIQGAIKGARQGFSAAVGGTDGKGKGGASG